MILINRRRAAQGGSPAPNYLITAASNPEVLAICYQYGLCANENYMTYEEAAAVTTTLVRVEETNVRIFQRSSITHFEEFEYFGITNLDSSAFLNCASLTNIVLPQNLLTLSGTAFQSCSSLESIDIPSNVTSIGANCFASCTGLQYAIVRATTPPTLGNTAAMGQISTSYTFNIYVPDASLNDYKTANNWSGYAARIKPLSEFVEPT